MSGELSSWELGDFLLCTSTMMFQLLYMTQTKPKSNKRSSICVLFKLFHKNLSRSAGNTTRSYCLCLHWMVMLHERDCLQSKIFIFCLHDVWWETMYFSPNISCNSLLQALLMQGRNAFNLTPITRVLFNVTLVANMLTAGGGESNFCDNSISTGCLF